MTKVVVRPFLLQRIKEGKAMPGVNDRKQIQKDLARDCNCSNKDADKVLEVLGYTRSLAYDT